MKQKPKRYLSPADRAKLEAARGNDGALPTIEQYNRMVDTHTLVGQRIGT